MSDQSSFGRWLREGGGRLDEWDSASGESFSDWLKRPGHGGMTPHEQDLAEKIQDVFNRASQPSRPKRPKQSKE